MKKTISQTFQRTLLSISLGMALATSFQAQAVVTGSYVNFTLGETPAQLQGTYTYGTIPTKETIGTGSTIKVPSHSLGFWNSVFNATSGVSLGATAAGVTTIIIKEGENLKKAKDAEDELNCNSDGKLSNGEPAFISGCLRAAPHGSDLPAEYNEYHYDNLQDLLDDLEDPSTFLPGYNENEPNAEGTAYYDGAELHARYTYNEADQSKSLVLQLIVGGEVEDEATFTKLPPEDQKALQNILKNNSTSSSKSIGTQLNDFFKSSQGKSFLRDVLRSTVEDAPYSPVAGNPSSYMAQLVRNDYQLINRVQTPSSIIPGAGVFGVAPNTATYLLGTQAATVYNVPLDYTKYLDANDNLKFDFPIGMTSIGKANSYNLGLGVGWQHYFFPIWSVMPALHVGLAGSADLLSGTIVYDGSVTSRVKFLSLNRFHMSMTNNISYLATQGFQVKGYSTEYDIDNFITKNGVDIGYQFESPLAVDVYYNNTDQIGGQKWYMSTYNEVGFKTSQLGYNALKQGNFLFNRFSTSVGYIFGPHKLSGIAAHFTFNF